MADLVERIERESGPIVLAIFNAGNYFPTRGERLEVFNFVRTFQINLFGTSTGWCRRSTACASAAGAMSWSSPR